MSDEPTALDLALVERAADAIARNHGITLAVMDPLDREDVMRDAAAALRAAVPVPPALDEALIECPACENNPSFIDNCGRCGGSGTVTTRATDDPCIHGPGVRNCGHPDCVGHRQFSPETLPAAPAVPPVAPALAPLGPCPCGCGVNRNAVGTRPCDWSAFANAVTGNGTALSATPAPAQAVGMTAAEFVGARDDVPLPPSVQHRDGLIASAPAPAVETELDACRPTQTPLMRKNNAPAYCLTHQQPHGLCASAGETEGNTP